MLNATYENQYQATRANIDFIVKSMAEKPGHAISHAIANGGQQAVQALFDAVLDNGNRMVLVRALDTPSMPGWVREQLTVFLYGEQRQTAALFKKAH